MTIRIPINKIAIQNALDIYNIMQMVLKREHEIDQNKEHFWTLALSEGNKILNLELVALGVSNMVHASPADILAMPLQKQAQGVILIHNHPSGTLQPSKADKDFTDLMIQACRLMKTPVLDHIIINEHSYFSFTETGLLEELEASLKYVPPYAIEKMSYKDGRKEMAEEIAKQMLQDGEPMEKIQKWTGLSEAKINALK